jgi:hypothetical protein
MEEMKDGGDPRADDNHHPLSVGHQPDVLRMDFVREDPEGMSTDSVERVAGGDGHPL